MSPAPTAPTTPPTRATPKIRLYRYLAGLALVLLGSAAYAFPDAAPWLGAVSTLAGVVVGKYLGVPHRDVITMGLQLMTPDQAVEVTVRALKSLPPAQTEAAATSLFASLPPAAQARLSLAPLGLTELPPAPPLPHVPHVPLVQFVGASAAPPADAAEVDTDEPDEPDEVTRPTHPWRRR